MRVVIADPPAYTPPYDYALAAALARQRRERAPAHVAVPLRSRAGGRRLHGRRQPLSRLERGELVARPARGEGARASVGARPARPRRLRPAPPAVGRSARGRRAVAPHAPPARLHRARPAAAPDGEPHEDLEAALRPLRPRRHPQRARPRDARGVRRRRRASCGSSPTPPSGAIRPGTTTAAPSSRSA